MARLIFILTLLLSFSLTGCAFGPLYSHETARTVGVGKAEVSGGYGNGGFVGKATYGVSEKIDIGLHWESLSLGGKFKYAFINSEQGLSASGSLGFGQSFSGLYYSGSGTLSYLTDIFEPYVTLSGVYVSASSSNTSLTVNGSSLALPKFSYGYFYLETIGGSRFWLTKDRLFISAEIGGIFTQVGALAVGSAGVGYRF